MTTDKKLEVKLEDILVDVQKYNKDNHLALVGDNAMIEYNRLRRYIPGHITVTISAEEDLFTRQAYCVDVTKVNIYK